jgi:uncharacterized membrane protein
MQKLNRDQSDGSCHLGPANVLASTESLTIQLLIGSEAAVYHGAHLYWRNAKAGTLQKTQQTL